MDSNPCRCFRKTWVPVAGRAQSSRDTFTLELSRAGECPSDNQHGGEMQGNEEMKDNPLWPRVGGFYPTPSINFFFSWNSIHPRFLGVRSRLVLPPRFPVPEAELCPPPLDLSLASGVSEGLGVLMLGTRLIFKYFTILLCLCDLEQ
uniref:Uncharacterized protein n=1 Tax=Molossus molossus TaxID=27622 RepID=A0A7J8C8H6_MOLMO|nr:hypothetical protein HJG59_009861 [Molossus molossus]